MFDAIRSTFKYLDKHPQEIRRELSIFTEERGYTLTLRVFRRGKDLIAINHTVSFPELQDAVEKESELQESIIRDLCLKVNDYFQK